VHAPRLLAGCKRKRDTARVAMGGPRGETQGWFPRLGRSANKNCYVSSEETTREIINS
jgi:hypothetical protein